MDCKAVRGKVKQCPPLHQHHPVRSADEAETSWKHPPTGQITRSFTRVSVNYKARLVNCLSGCPSLDQTSRAEHELPFVWTHISVRQDHHPSIHPVLLMSTSQPASSTGQQPLSSSLSSFWQAIHSFSCKFCVAVASGGNREGWQDGWVNTVICTTICG